MTTPAPAAEPLLDWTAAAQIAARLARPGATAPRDELDALVAGLRAAAGDAVGHVLEVTGMEPAAARAAGGGFGDVHVVDRAGWTRANAQSMRAMTDPVMTAIATDVPATSAAARLAGAAEVGGLLALLSGRVLGQFDPYGADHAPGYGRLLLVAPNVLQVERALGLRPRDFRLWVCLHEQTHALQFATAPWLADHLVGRIGDLLHGVTASATAMTRAPLRQKVAVVGRTVLRAARGELVTPLDGVLGPEQRRELEEVTAVMALLEGHADVMMDAVGPRVVRSVRTIRARFEKRRDGEGAPALDVVLRRVLGMDAKLAQYRDGAAFVRAVEERVGRDGLNAVWSAPGHLPSAREIADPRAWVRRVHG
ncbi:zinc-dependent metalloprotease [Krasilnikoviella flava]|uniref:zinc-dependent metalloprotease n=1 Tax=Krasilnikoviella flava TaxID=526729 RepID=UPI001C3780B9|nr:zinc-dependent metalloprotease [Krasilnikoviella flava]